MTSRLDCGNALLHDLLQTRLQCLQRVQNTSTRKHEPITPALQRLHWLPIRLRLTYKVLPYVCSAMNGSIGLPRGVTQPTPSESAVEVSLFVFIVCTGFTDGTTHGDRRFAVATTNSKCVAPCLLLWLPLYRFRANIFRQTAISRLKNKIYTFRIPKYCQTTIPSRNCTRKCTIIK